MATIGNIYGNGTSTATAGANTIVHYYDRAGIKAANRVNIFQQFADRKSMPTKMGKTFKISRFEHMYDRRLADADFSKYGYMTNRTATAVNTALTNAVLSEGDTDVNKRSLYKITYDCSFARYGEMIDYTDEVDIFSEDYIQVRYREELGEAANAKYEDLVQLGMLETTTVLYSGDATSQATIGSTPGVEYGASYDLIRKATRILTRNRAKKNTSVITGTNQIGTTPVAKAYYAIIGADVKADLESQVRGAGQYQAEFAYIPAHKYAGASTLAEGEVGAMHEVRFVEAESMVAYLGAGATVPAGNAGGYAYTGTIGTDAKFNVYPILFPTEGAYATVGLKGHEKIKFNSKSPENVDSGNTYGTRGFFSYNFFFAGIILKPEALLKVYVAAKA